MHIDEIKHALKTMSENCAELADKLGKGGRPFNAEEKKLVRTVMVDQIANRMDETLWFLWRGHAVDFDRALDGIRESVDGII